MTELLDCPFCGSPAEEDIQRPYRDISRGDIGNAVAIFCQSCSADMTLCCEDFPDDDPDALLERLRSEWNSRNGVDGWHRSNAPKTGEQILAEVMEGYFQVVHWSDDAWRENTNMLALRKPFLRWKRITPLATKPEGVAK